MCCAESIVRISELMRSFSKIALLSYALTLTTSCGLYREAKTPEVADAIAASETSVVSGRNSEVGTGSAGSYGPGSFPFPLNEGIASNQSGPTAGSETADSIQSSPITQFSTSQPKSSDAGGGGDSTGQVGPIVDFCLELYQLDSAANDLVFSAKNESSRLVESLRELRRIFSRLSTAMPTASQSVPMLRIVDKGLSDLIDKAVAGSDPVVIVDQVKLGLERFSPEITQLLQSLNRLCPSMKSTNLTRPEALESRL